MGGGLSEAGRAYLDEIVACDPTRPYNRVFDRLAGIEQVVRERLGADGLADLRAWVLIAALNGQRFKPMFTLTPEVTLLREASHARIRATCHPAARMHYARYDDRFLKDLALATGLVFPAGARIVQPGMGFPRSLVKSDGIGQAVAFLALMARLRSNRDVFQLHVHPDELEEFNEAGWRRTLGRIARMLLANPCARAVYGSSWLYAPDLARASPRLGYVRAIALESGARSFLVGSDRSGDALQTSLTRRTLFVAGEYVPRIHAVVWPRDVLVRRAREW